MQIMFVRSVVCLLKGKKAKKPTGNVLDANIVSPGPNSVSVSTTYETEESSDMPSAPAMPFDFSKIDPEKIKMAEDFGIPVGQIITWASTVEARLNAIQVEMEPAIQKAMEAAIENARQKQLAAMQQMGQNTPQGGGGFNLDQLLPALISSGGGGMDEEYMTLAKDALKSQIGMSTAITNAVVSKIIGKAATEVAAVVTGE